MKIAPWLVVLFTFLLLACEKDGTDEVPLISDVEEEFSVRLYEHFTAQTRALNFEISTLKDKPCDQQQVEIDYMSQADNNKTIITIKGLTAKETTVCDRTQALAKGNIVFDSLQLKQSIGLELNIGVRVTNEGNINTLPETYDLELSSANGLIVPYKTLRKMPAQTLWGYVGVSEERYETIKTAFLNDLMFYTSIKRFKQGYYGYFTVSGVNEFELVEQSNSKHVTPIVLQNDATLEELRALVNSYKQQYGEQITIELFTTMGAV